MECKIATLNLCLGLKSKKNLIKETILHERIDIPCMQETEIDIGSLHRNGMATIPKKFATLAVRPVFVSLFFIQKQLIYDFLAGNNYPDSPHLHGDRGMKFAT